MQAPYIIVTGAAGFIGSQTDRYLNNLGYQELILVDNVSKEAKRANW
jgi:ADP-L-glycero-D-manno-heptose 6-epimerase